MAEKKFSQLTAKGATIADTDLVAISESAGGGTYTTKSVTGANIKGLVTDANLTTTDITTNDVSTAKHGFAPKAPNDATKYLDGTGAWSTPAGGGGGLTVGTTAVTSGTDTRVFFQAGGVLQQSANLTFDTGDLRIGNGSASSKSGIRVWNGTTTNTAGGEFYIGTDNNIYIKTNNANEIRFSNPTANVLTIGSGNQASITRLNINGASTTPTFSVAAEATTTSSYPFYVSGLASTRFNLMNGAGQFGINKPSNTLGANLDISASGALSTDIAFRVRNSGDTDNIISIAGNGVLTIHNGTAPTTSETDAFRMYSADITAGNAAPHFRTEAGNIIKLYQQSSAGITTVADLVTVLQNLGLLS